MVLWGCDYLLNYGLMFCDVVAMKVGAEDEEGYGLSNKSNVCEQKTMPLYPELFKVLHYGILRV